MRPQNLNIVNMLGYGDAYLAGLIHAYLQQKPTPEVLRYASAAGLTDVEDIHKEIRNLPTIQENLSRIKIEVINFD